MNRYILRIYEQTEKLSNQPNVMLFYIANNGAYHLVRLHLYTLNIYVCVNQALSYLKKHFGDYMYKIKIKVSMYYQ